MKVKDQEFVSSMPEVMGTVVVWTCVLDLNNFHKHKSLHTHFFILILFIFSTLKNTLNYTFV